MNYSKIARLSCALIIVIMVLFLKTGEAKAASSPNGKIHHHFASRLHSAAALTDNELNDVVATSSNTAWAVGDYHNNGSSSQTLAEYWNGTTWSIISSPNPGRPNVVNVLFSVAAVSANDIWAVGYYGNPDYNTFSQTLAEHWNGKTWSSVASPNPGGGESNSVNVLQDVTAISTNDVWAVGWFNNANQTLIEHWDGSSWSVVTSPNVGSSGDWLAGITALSSNNIWAVGNYWNGSVWQTHTEHWDGTSWSVVSSPNPGGPNQDNTLSGVAQLSANDIWAAGYYGTNSTQQALLEHWNGTTWSAIPSASPGSSCYNFFDTTAASSNDVWAVGFYSDNGNNVCTDSNGYICTDSNNVCHTLTEHWNGTTWSVVPGPNFGGSGADNSLESIGQASSNNVWAVGWSSIGSNNFQVIIEHWNGSTWSLVPPGH